MLTAKPVALVTGISGMIGSFVARELLARGYEVHGVVRYRTHWGNLRGERDGRAPPQRGEKCAKDGTCCTVTFGCHQGILRTGGVSLDGTPAAQSP